MSDVSATLLREAANAMRIGAQELSADASWHPAVALAVADWLDVTAKAIDTGFASFASRHAALAVAHAYLGGDQ